MSASFEELKNKAIELYNSGMPCSQISLQIDRSPTTISRWLRSEGIEVKIPGRKKGVAPKKAKYGQLVLDLHNQGKYVSEIVDALPEVLHYSTIEEWIRNEGLTPHHKYIVKEGVQRNKTHLAEDLVRDYLDGMMPKDLCKKYEVNNSTVFRWINKAGVQGLGGQAVRDEKDQAIVVENHLKGFTAPQISKSTGLGLNRVYAMLMSAGYKESLAVCEAPDCNNPTKGYAVKFCSEICRTKHQDRRQADPNNFVTFNCETCNKEVTRRKGLNAKRFCSNACSARSYNVKARLDDVVFDSGWEAMFWGLCKFLKIPIERVDRSQAVSFDGKTYAPDFFLPDFGYIEVKGLVDEDDVVRWRKWKEEYDLLIVIDQVRMEILRKYDREDFMVFLKNISLHQEF